jgi:hypothetical protein
MKYLLMKKCPWNKEQQDVSLIDQRKEEKRGKRRKIIGKLFKMLWSNVMSKLQLFQVEENWLSFCLALL